MTEKTLTLIIVNFNCFDETINLLNDLNKQTTDDFVVRLFDQGSTTNPENLREILSKFKYEITFIQNGYNKSLNQIWIEEAKKCSTKLIGMLNNDIRITNNYVESSIAAFRNYNIIMAIHPTNNINFLQSEEALNVKLLKNEKIKHGWEFITKPGWLKETNIPHDLKFYCGDDIIFERIYNAHLLIGYILNSPIIHHTSSTVNSNINSKLLNKNKMLKDDVNIYTRKYNRKIFLKANDQYSNIFITWDINEKNLVDINRGI